MNFKYTVMSFCNINNINEKSTIYYSITFSAYVRQREDLKPKCSNSLVRNCGQILVVNVYVTF